MNEPEASEESDSLGTNEGHLKVNKLLVSTDCDHRCGYFYFV